MPTLARLKKLPWGVLGIEFVVVILGILSALSVDSWWSSRADHREEAQYLVRLHRDLVRTSGVLEEEMGIHRATEERIRMVLEELQTGPSPGGIQLLEESIGYAAGIRWFIPFHTTYEELIATGKLALVSSDTLRSALGAYHRQIEASGVFYERMLDKFSERIEPSLGDHLVFSDVVVPGMEGGVSPSPFDTDASSFYGNRDLWNLLTVRLDMERGILHRQERMRVPLAAALSLTAEELERRGATHQE
jgi:hypothetical protein